MQAHLIRFVGGFVTPEIQIPVTTGGHENIGILSQMGRAPDSRLVGTLTANVVCGKENVKS